MTPGAHDQQLQLCVASQDQQTHDVQQHHDQSRLRHLHSDVTQARLIRAVPLLHARLLPLANHVIQALRIQLVHGHFTPPPRRHATQDHRILTVRNHTDQAAPIRQPPTCHHCQLVFDLFDT